MPPYSIFPAQLALQSFLPPPPAQKIGFYCPQCLSVAACVSEPVKRYGSSEQPVLPAALSFLHAKYDTLLCPDTSLDILPGGKIRYTRPQQGSSDYDREFYDKHRSGVDGVFETRVPPSRGSSPYCLSGSPITENLPFMLNVCPRAEIGQFTMPPWSGDAPASGSLPHANGVNVPELDSEQFVISRDEHRLNSVTFVREIVRTILNRDNRLCLGALSELPKHGEPFEYGGNTRICDLLESVRKAVNPDPDSPVMLDTVLLPRRLFSMLAPVEGHEDSVPTRSSEADCPPMLGLGHESIPDSTPYAISSAHGPTFIDGPTTITCTEYEFVVNRYSGVVLLPASDPAMPYGFEIAVKAAS